MPGQQWELLRKEPGECMSSVCVCVLVLVYCVCVCTVHL